PRAQGSFGSTARAQAIVSPAGGTLECGGLPPLLARELAPVGDVRTLGPRGKRWRRRQAACRKAVASYRTPKVPAVEHSGLARCPKSRRAKTRRRMGSALGALFVLP